MEYKIKNYTKLLCIRIDHFESRIVDECNTDNFDEIGSFISRYQNQENLKIAIIQMCDMNMMILDNIRKNIHYIVNKEYDLFPINEFEKLELNFLLGNTIESNICS